MYASAGIERSQQPKIVASTCLLEEVFLKKAQDSGIDLVMAKPLRLSEFANYLLRLELIEGIPENVRSLPFSDF